MNLIIIVVMEKKIKLNAKYAILTRIEPKYLMQREHFAYAMMVM